MQVCYSEDVIQLYLHGSGHLEHGGIRAHCTATTMHQFWTRELVLVKVIQLTDITFVADNRKYNQNTYPGHTESSQSMVCISLGSFTALISMITHMHGDM